jgi:hypothetical protein
MSVHGLRSVLSDAKGASVGHRVYKTRGKRSPSPSPCTRGLTGCKVHAGTLLFLDGKTSWHPIGSVTCATLLHLRVCGAVRYTVFSSAPRAS